LDDGSKTLISSVLCRLVIVIAFIATIVLPPIPERNLGSRIVVPWTQILPFFLPELLVGLFCLVLLPAAWLRRRWAGVPLLAVAALLPALKFLAGDATYGVWPFVSPLLVLIGVRFIRRPASAAVCQGAAAADPLGGGKRRF
jgi:hypothetical protein